MAVPVGHGALIGDVLAGTQLLLSLHPHTSSMRLRPLRDRASPLGIAIALMVCLVAAMTPTASVDAEQVALATTTGAATLVYNQNFPDPSVLVADHTYYAYSTTTDEENVPVIESSDFTNWRAIGDAMSILPSWATEGTVWAPSVTTAPSGGYEIFFNAYDQAEGIMCLGRATSLSPLGPFVDVSEAPFLCQPSAGGSIDPSVYRSGGADYLVWKSDGEGRQPQVIVSGRLTADDSRLVGEPTDLLSANQPWEDGVVEGPGFVDISGALYLFFSGNEWSTAKYAIGATTCASPLGPCAAAAVQQVNISPSIVTGAGGPSFFVTQGHTYMAFAAWTDGVVGNELGHRALFLTVLDHQQDVATFVAAPAVNVKRSGDAST